MIGWQRICCAIVYAAATKELRVGNFPTHYTDDESWFRYGHTALAQTEAIIWWYTEGKPKETT